MLAISRLAATEGDMIAGVDFDAAPEDCKQQ
jgi:hypothetical protein